LLLKTRNFIQKFVIFLGGAGLFASAAYFFVVSRQAPILYRSHIAVPGFQSSALVILAYEKGYFRKEGVDVSLEFKATGRDCLALVVKGDADLAVVFETPITRSLLEGNKISVLTELHRSEQNTAVVARKDRNIRNAEDLVGKTVATISKTNAEFHLDLFLRSHMVDPSKVTIKQMTTAEAVNAVARGEVDAAALWQPYVSQSIHEDPSQFELLKSTFYSEFSMLAGLRDKLEAQQETNLAILRALLAAKKYFNSENQEARRLVEKILEEKKFFVSASAWDQMDIHLGLSSTLLTIFQVEADWYRSLGDLSGMNKIDHVFNGRDLKILAPHLVTYE
jgi:NitT/TauT family transport system substrate-binding protein